jgi:5-methylcytosine-specific restriction protein A
MPYRAPGTCRIPGCPRLSHGGGLCDEHKVQRQRQLAEGRHYSDLQRPTATERGYGFNWRKLRNAFIRDHPYCADPFGIHKGALVDATDVHHIISKKEGGSNADSNLQSLCHSCHSRHTDLEDGGGWRRRW